MRRARDRIDTAVKMGVSNHLRSGTWYLNQAWDKPSPTGNAFASEHSQVQKAGNELSPRDNHVFFGTTRGRLGLRRNTGPASGSTRSATPNDTRRWRRC